jgi:hypothetical protein
MKNAVRRNPYLVFAGCALIAAFGAWLLRFSGGRTENEWGLVLLVVFGLGSVVLPLLIQRSVEQMTDERPERREPK